METWSFEPKNCLNFNMRCQKCHDATNDVKVIVLICEFVRCMLFLANIPFYHPYHVNNGIRRKVGEERAGCFARFVFLVSPDG